MTDIICVVAAAARDNANAVWVAMGRGPGTFSRKLCVTDPGATSDTPPTHYLMSDTDIDELTVRTWQGFALGDLPAIDGVWGQDDVISVADAMDAINGTNLQVYSASGDVVPTDHATGILASRTLQFVPDPPL